MTTQSTRLKIIAKQLFYIVTAAMLISMLSISCTSNIDPQELSFSLELTEGTLDPDIIKVNQGDTITLNFMSDKDVTIHLHGYNIETKIEKDTTGTIGPFVANIALRLPIKAHSESDSDHHHDQEGHDEESNDSELTVGYLEVKPN